MRENWISILSATYSVNNRLFRDVTVLNSSWFPGATCTFLYFPTYERHERGKAKSVGGLLGEYMKKQVHAALYYLGCTLGSKLRICSLKRKAQVCQSKAQIRRMVAQNYAPLLWDNRLWGLRIVYCLNESKVHKAFKNLAG